MKIIINYDLIDKIKEAKKGFSLVKSTKKVLLKSSICEMFYLILRLILIPFDPIKEILSDSIEMFTFYLLLYTLSEYIEKLTLKNINKIEALDELKKLSSILKDLNICTDYELLMDSYNYETEYKVKNEENSFIPKINQKKYIMIPVYDDGEIKEVSLVQEHTIGSKNYIISIGEPTKQKVFKPAFGAI